MNKLNAVPELSELSEVSKTQSPLTVHCSATGLEIQFEQCNSSPFDLSHTHNRPRYLHPSVQFFSSFYEETEYLRSVIKQLKTRSYIEGNFEKNLALCTCGILWKLHSRFSTFTGKEYKVPAGFVNSLAETAEREKRIFHAMAAFCDAFLDFHEFMKIDSPVIFQSIKLPEAEKLPADYAEDYEQEMILPFLKFANELSAYGSNVKKRISQRTDSISSRDKAAASEVTKFKEKKTVDSFADALDDLDF